MNTQRIIHLTPPQLADGNIKEKITCIRAHRERIAYIGTEQQNNKLICHNYGHGGAGWTFLFGCVQESLAQFEQEITQNPERATQPICVVGAGCYGLLTAIMLKRAGHTVRIAAKQTTNLPSHKAAGFFFPRARKSSKPHERAQFATRGMNSFMVYQTIINGTHPFITRGAQMLPAYFGLDADIAPGLEKYAALGLMPAPEKVTITFGNGKEYEAFEYRTLFINPAIMMQELEAEVARLGIGITHQEIGSWHDAPEQIIFNCAGLGVRQLTNDKLIVPSQGHLITLQQQPDVAQLQYMINFKVVQTDAQGNQRDEMIYFAPKEEGILGITFKRGVDSLTANPYEFDRLLERCHTFFGT